MKNRILIVGPPGSGKLTLLRELTGSVPEVNEDHSGVSHKLTLSNKYYTAEIDVWIDEFGRSEETSVQEWVKSFTSDEAAEVREVLGAVIFTFDPVKHDYKALSKQFEPFRDLLEEEEYEGVFLAVSKRPTSCLEEAIDHFLDMGTEYLDLQEPSPDPEGNLRGVPRIKEALQEYKWVETEQSETEPIDPLALLKKAMMGNGSQSKEKVEEWEGFFSQMQTLLGNQQMSKEERWKKCEELAELVEGWGDGDSGDSDSGSTE